MSESVWSSFWYFQGELSHPLLESHTNKQLRAVVQQPPLLAVHELVIGPVTVLEESG
jgi:hypothetical protein